jgi:hypothetical protein
MKISKVDIDSLHQLEETINSYKNYFTLLHRQRCLCEENCDVIHEASKLQNQQKLAQLEGERNRVCTALLKKTENLQKTYKEWSEIECQLDQYDCKIQETDFVMHLDPNAEDLSYINESVRKLTIFRHGLDQIESGISIMKAC